MPRVAYLAALAVECAVCWCCLCSCCCCCCCCWCCLCCCCCYFFCYMSVCLSVCLFVCMPARMHLCTYICMYACMHVCMYEWMHVCMHARTYVCMYVCMYVVAASGGGENNAGYCIHPSDLLIAALSSKLIAAGHLSMEGPNHENKSVRFTCMWKTRTFAKLKRPLQAFANCILLLCHMWRKRPHSLAAKPRCWPRVRKRCVERVANITYSSWVLLVRHPVCS